MPWGIIVPSYALQESDAITTLSYPGVGVGVYFLCGAKPGWSAASIHSGESSARISRVRAPCRVNCILAPLCLMAMLLSHEWVLYFIIFGGTA